MTVGVAIKALVVWVAILALAIVNGVLREAVLAPVLGTVAGLIVSGLLLCSLILIVAYLFVPWLNVRGSGQLLLVGFGWLGLTLIFEFSFGLMQGKSLAEVLEAYTFKGGNLWPLVLMVTTMAPWIATRLRGGH